MPRRSNKSKASSLLVRADKHLDRGEMKAAFRLMLASVNLGNTGAQINVGELLCRRRGCSAKSFKGIVLGTNEPAGVAIEVPHTILESSGVMREGSKAISTGSSVPWRWAMTNPIWIAESISC